MEKFTKSKLVAQIAITSFVAALAIVGVAYATTIGTNISTTGTLGTATTTIAAGNLIVDTNTLLVNYLTDKVGIGTTTPFATLSIDTNSGVNAFVIGSSTATYLTVNTVGNLIVDTNTLYVNAVNNKVGIGTTTPFATLSIDVDEAINPFVIGSSTSTYLSMSHDGNLTVDAGTLYVDAVNNKVGIGSTTPWGALSVKSTATNQLILSYNNTNYTTFAISSGGDLTLTPSGKDMTIAGNLSVSTTTVATGDLIVDTNTLLVDSSTNRVGIASTTPSAMLSVNIAPTATSATTTIDFAKPCFRMADPGGNVLYYTLCVEGNTCASNGAWATSTTSCFE